VPEPDVPESRPVPTARFTPFASVTLILPASATRPDAVTAALFEATWPLLISIDTDVITWDALPGAWPVGYAAGNIGYLYPADALGQGGYEVEVAHRLYGTRQAGPGTSDALANGAINAVSGG